jgi:hypothetical protein
VNLKCNGRFLITTRKKNTIDFIFWNDASDEPCDIVVIVNNERIIKVEKLHKFTWRIETLGKTTEVKNIKIIINDKLKNSININESNIKEFKLNNFMTYD